MAKTTDTTQDGARKLALQTARLVEDRNFEEIVILDLRETSAVTNYFVIATGTSDRQIRAVSEEIEREAKAIGEKVYRVAGREAADWVVMDFVDVVVHLFTRPLRDYYDLELIWGEVPHVEHRGDSAS